MDPIQIAGSALKILNQVREQLKACEETFEEAKELNKAIKSFEVTILMIPSRNSSASEQTDSSASGAQNEGITQNPLHQNSNPLFDQKHARITEAGDGPREPFVQPEGLGMGLTGASWHARITEAGVQLISMAKDIALQQIESTIPGGNIINDTANLLRVGKDVDPLDDPADSPGEAMRKMKMKTEKGIRVHSDLEVMFCGMCYIIKMAMEAIVDAFGTIQKLREMGRLSCWWLCQPWKIQKTLALRDDFTGHYENMKKHQHGLQTAIGIASYAVQLEQLEGVLDATTSIQQRDMKQLWKRKMGSDKTKVPMSEFCEAIFSQLETELKEKRADYTSKEIIDRSKNKAEIALSRALNDIYNANFDNYLSVYELSQELDKNVKADDTGLGYTLNEIVTSEWSFLKNIQFKFVKYDIGTDKIVGTSDDKIQIFNDGTPLRVRPFHRPLIVAEVPVWTENQVFEFDHLILLKHDISPLGKERDKPFKLKSLKSSTCYVDTATEDTMNDTRWSAPTKFTKFKGEMGGAGGEGHEPYTPFGFKNHRNVEIYEKDRHGNVTSTTKEEDDNEQELDTETQSFVRILYTPMIFRPGYYSPRYCLTSFVEADTGDISHRKLQMAPKSYYRGNVEESIAYAKRHLKTPNTNTNATTRASTVKRRSITHRASLLPPGVTGEAEMSFRVNANVGPMIYCTDDLEIAWAPAEDSDNESDDDDNEDKERKKREIPKRLHLLFSVPLSPQQKSHLEAN
jgi:hypothetical protein